MILNDCSGSFVGFIWLACWFYVFLWRTKKYEGKKQENGLGVKRADAVSANFLNLKYKHYAKLVFGLTLALFKAYLCGRRLGGASLWSQCLRGKEEVEEFEFILSCIGRVCPKNVKNKKEEKKTNKLKSNSNTSTQDDNLFSL